MPLRVREDCDPRGMPIRFWDCWVKALELRLDIHILPDPDGLEHLGQLLLAVGLLLHHLGLHLGVVAFHADHRRQGGVGVDRCNIHSRVNPFRGYPSQISAVAGKTLAKKWDHGCGKAGTKFQETAFTAVLATSRWA